MIILRRFVFIFKDTYLRIEEMKLVWKSSCLEIMQIPVSKTLILFFSVLYSAVYA